MALISAYAINIVITEYEKDITPANFCVPRKSPAKSVIAAITAIKTPHTSSLFFDGLMSTLLESIAITKVPEFADVIRKVATRAKHTIVVNFARGNISMRSQSAIDILLTDESARADVGCLKSWDIALPPNIVIQLFMCKNQ